MLAASSRHCVCRGAARPSSRPHSRRLPDPPRRSRAPGTRAGRDSHGCCRSTTCAQGHQGKEDLPLSLRGTTAAWTSIHASIFCDGGSAAGSEQRSFTWLADFERVVKRSVGNSLSDILIGDAGTALRSNEHHAETWRRALELVEPVRLGDTVYAVRRDGVLLESLAEQMSAVATAVREGMPSYPLAS